MSSARSTSDGRCYDTGLFHPDPPLLPLRTSDLDTEFYHTDMKVLADHFHGQLTVLYCVPTNPGPARRAGEGAASRVVRSGAQGKPSEDARRGRCHPLEAGIYPCGCHCYRDTQLPSTKYQPKGEKGFLGNPDWDPATSMTLVFASATCPRSEVRVTAEAP